MELINLFLDYLRLEKCYSDKTIQSYQCDILQFGVFVEKKRTSFSPCLVDSLLIREWIVVLMDKGYSAASVKRKLSSLRSFYKYLLRLKKIDRNPLSGLNSPKLEKKLPMFLKPVDVDRLLDEVDFGDGFAPMRDRLIIEVFYCTGIRRSELINLNLRDVDLGLSLLKVTGKRNKQRLVPFAGELKKDIEEYLLKRSQLDDLQTDAFFVTVDGKRMYATLVYNIVKRALSKVVCMKKRSPHVLRHTFATSMLNNEAELNVVKELLGHASLAATEVYTHSTFEELKKVYKQAHPRS